MRWAALVSLILFSSQAWSALEHIRNLSGCFDVSYRFVENNDHEYDLRGGIYEWVSYEELNDGSVYLQHYGIHEGEAMTHWGEHWSEASAGVWRQTVMSPSGELRYECEAPFVANQWRCLAEGAPKPQRDLHRTDYETLDRENTLQITANGWVHSQNNTKRDADGLAVGNELGWNEYRRVENTHCGEIASDSKR